eukprot:7065948-Pyramimonas_sp.AAC.1
MGGSSDQSAAVQMDIIQTFTDEVTKKNSMQSFIDIMGSCSAIIGECDMDAIDTSNKGIDDAT